MYQSKSPSYPAYIQATLSHENPFIFRHAAFYDISSASDLKAKINEFISKINAENNSNIPLI